ncbi:Beta-lactamase [Fusarium albosuccineum]|uniref:Beta-lactamase n=1 Tax=Fusarium albosuccineum TaxID=1237068 RepID=A0A8H4KZX5_9HYPO|nr:Beta-lactamase [Fusarium albosuccineum]
MFPKRLLRLAAVISGMANYASALPAKQPSCLRVENFINEGIGFNVISSLIIGSESAVLVDVPIDIPHAEVLADWIRNTTDKPLVAVFTTHHHPDHNLGARAILDQFDQASFFASKNAVKHLINETPQMSERMRLAFGRDNITDNPALPSVYPNTFFTLSGHEDEPIHLISNVLKYY